MCDGDDLDSSRRELSIDQEERKLPQKIPTAARRPSRPALRIFEDLLQSAIYFSVKSASCIRASLHIPIESCVILRSRLVVKLNLASGHQGVWPSYAFLLQTKGQP